MWQLSLCLLYFFFLMCVWRRDCLLALLTTGPWQVLLLPLPNSPPCVFELLTMSQRSAWLTFVNQEFTTRWWHSEIYFEKLSHRIVSRHVTFVSQPLPRQFQCPWVIRVTSPPPCFPDTPTVHTHTLLSSLSLKQSCHIITAVFIFKINKIKILQNLDVWINVLPLALVTVAVSSPTDCQPPSDHLACPHVAPPFTRLLSQAFVHCRIALYDFFLFALFIFSLPCVLLSIGRPSYISHMLQRYARFSPVSQSCLLQ